MRFEFLTKPPAGTLLFVDDQRYRLAIVEPYTRADGASSAVLTWSTECPDCGATFEVKTGLKGKDINRRCSSCRTPMKRVRPDRKRQAIVRVEEAR